MLFDVIFIIGLYVFLLKSWYKSKNLLIKTIFYIYMIGVLYLTIMPILTSLPHLFDHSYTFNFHLFIDVFYERGDYLRQIVLNIMMTIPLGFFLNQIYHFHFFKSMLLSFFIVLTIELMQPILHGNRIFDITDLLTNTLGSIIGYCLCYWFRHLKIIDT